MSVTPDPPDSYLILPAALRGVHGSLDKPAEDIEFDLPPGRSRRLLVNDGDRLIAGLGFEAAHIVEPTTIRVDVTGHGVKPESIKFIVHPPTKKLAPKLPMESAKMLRVIRLFEYHSMHLSWVRSLAIEPSSTDAQIADCTRISEKHRSMLLDLAPNVLALSVVDTLRAPAFYDVGSKRPQVEGLTHAEARALVLAKIDHLMTAIRRQWVALDGVKAERP